LALLHVDFFSDALGMCAEMDVILPERARGQIGMNGVASNEKYPTLYLLHGMSDDHTIWQRRTSIERYVSDLGLAVVMPSTHLGWYTDMYRGHKYWTYISQELPAICRSFFPNMSDKREDTFAAGLSMGGYGAMKCGLCAPETFSKVASLSGGLDAASICENNKVQVDNTLWEDIFGPADKVRGSLFNIIGARVYDARVLDLFLSECGKHKSIRGDVYTGACSLLTDGINMGRDTGALTDGRHAGEPLGNSMGPRPGADKNGISAMLASVAKLPLQKGVGGTTLNDITNP